MDISRLRRDFVGELRAAEKGLGVAPNDIDLIAGKFSALLDLVRVDEARKFIEDVHANADVDPEFESELLFREAMARLLMQSDGFEDSARRLFLTDHIYRDYIRLMLYWALRKEGLDERAYRVLEDRWSLVDRNTWPSRLEQGDADAWREMLIGYFIGELDRDDIFGVLEDPQEFKASTLSHLERFALSREGLLCEAYFYDALYQGVHGPEVDRRERLMQSLEKVIATNFYTFFEYQMAVIVKTEILEASQ